MYTSPMQSRKDNYDQRIRVGILFGGKSAEHEVSLKSAESILQAIDTAQFEPILIGIDKTGRWHFDADVARKVSPANRLQAIAADASDGTTVALVPGAGDGSLVAVNKSNAISTLDVIFPVMHGPMGEDGTIQGLLELANIPYVGSGILGSAVGMDKDIMKRLLRDGGIAVADFEVVRTDNLSSEDVDRLVQRLGMPLFVKPANMGSSIGVSKVNSKEGLLPAITEALQFDAKVLVERTVIGDEIECAILGNDNPQASIVGRVIPNRGFYSYEAKYIDENGAILEIPSDIAPDISEKARATAIEAFSVLGCEGMSRVDMFATKDGAIMVNEINTIPGFTKISMYPKLWEASGVPYTELITQLIRLAIEHFERRQKLQTTYKRHLR